MSGLVARFVFNKIFRENSENKQGAEDPYFETVPSTRLGRKTTKKRKKALPPGLSLEDERTLNKVKRRAYRLDMAFGDFCGMKVGWSSIIGIIPGIGDVIDCIIPFYRVHNGIAELTSYRNSDARVDGHSHRLRGKSSSQCSRSNDV
jgi:Domain of unknown function (DUF4112)